MGSNGLAIESTIIISGIQLAIFPWVRTPLNAPHVVAWRLLHFRLCLLNTFSHLHRERKWSWTHSNSWVRILTHIFINEFMNEYAFLNEMKLLKLFLIIEQFPSSPILFLCCGHLEWFIQSWCRSREIRSSSYTKS